MDLDPIFLRDGLLIFFLLAASVVVHEWGHAIAAHLLGDDTPRMDGRVTLDPRAHFDLFGTIIVPLINIFIFGGGVLVPFFAWGKPVITNPLNFRNRIRDDILVSLAGPAANLLVAFVAILVGSFIVPSVPRFGELVKTLLVMNVGLAVFNLLPVPPLDGGSMLRRLVGISDEAYLMMSRWSWLVLLVMIRLTFCRDFILRLVELTCEPYYGLCISISRRAAAIIFST